MANGSPQYFQPMHPTRQVSVIPSDSKVSARARLELLG